MAANLHVAASLRAKHLMHWLALCADETPKESPALCPFVTLLLICLQESSTAAGGLRLQICILQEPFAMRGSGC